MNDPGLPNSPLEPNPATKESALPATPPQNLDSDIHDELTDHLSLAARDLQLAGHTADEAQHLAHQKFGDVAAIRRRLWWIQQGDEIMLRTALAIVCAVLVIAVAALGIGNWRMSRTIDDLHTTLADLNENQKKISDAQKSLLEAQQLNRPLTIHGRLYEADPSMPAPGAAVHLYRLSDSKLIDKYTADAQGRFVTAPLAPDRYFVVAPLGGFNPLLATNPPRREPSPSQVTEQALPLFGSQSAPIEVSIDGKQPQINLDVQPIPVGQVSLDPPRVSVSIRWPSFEPRRGQFSDEQLKREKSRYELALKLKDKGIKSPGWLNSVLRVVVVKQGSELPVISTSRASKNEQAPTRGIYGGRYGRTQAWGGYIPTEIKMLFFQQLGPNFDLVEAGKYQFAAYVTVQPFEPATRARPATTPSEDPEAVALKRMKSLPSDTVQEIVVEKDKRTHLRLIAPAEFDKDVLAAIENASNQEEFDALFDRVWPVKVEQLGYEDMILKYVER